APMAVAPGFVVAPLEAGGVVLDQHEFLAEEDGVRGTIRYVGDPNGARRPRVGVTRPPWAGDNRSVPGRWVVRRTPRRPAVARIVHQHQDGADLGRGTPRRAVENGDDAPSNIRIELQGVDIALFDER